MCSGVLDEFNMATKNTSDELYASFHKLASLGAYHEISAIYCYWRVEREILHPDYKTQVRVRVRVRICLRVST